MFFIGLPKPTPFRAFSIVFAVTALGVLLLSLVTTTLLLIVTPNSFNSCFTNALFFQGCL